MRESLRALAKEVSQLYGLGAPDEEERIVVCRYCGAVLKLIGLPPTPEPGEPVPMIYYPMQHCPQCGAEVERALDIEPFLMAPWYVEPIYAPQVQTIICQRCGSELKVTLSQYYPPPLATLETKYCPVCGKVIPLETYTMSTVEVISEKPWPPVAEEVEPSKTYKVILVVGVATTMFLLGAGISHLIKKRR